MGLIKDFLELHPIVSCHRISQGLNAAPARTKLDRTDKILQELPLNPANKQEKKGEAKWI